MIMRVFFDMQNKNRKSEKRRKQEKNKEKRSIHFTNQIFSKKLLTKAFSLIIIMTVAFKRK